MNARSREAGDRYCGSQQNAASLLMHRFHFSRSFFRLPH
jgi:hypothetical protein